MNALVRRFLFPVMVLSSLVLQGCQSAGDAASYTAFTLFIWIGIPLVYIVSLPFLPLALIGALQEAPPGPVAVAYLPGGNEMVAVHKEGDFQHLDRMALADLSITPLTRGSRFDIQPVVSPDGRHIAFATAKTASKSKANLILCVQATDGSNLHEITGGTSKDACPRFSPDGKWVVYASSADGKEADIFMVDIAGGPPRRLTSGPENDFYPVFLSDNERILFARAALFGDSYVAAKGWRQWDWYTVCLDGTDLKRLTDRKYFDITLPELSPDGAHVLFSPGFSRDEDTVSLLHLDDSLRAEDLRPQGSQYTIEDKEEQYTWTRLERAHFSPEGDAILFTLKKQKGKQTIAEVHWMDLKTGEAHQLTRLGMYISDFACSPKGDFLALLVSNPACKKSDYRTELWITDMDGTNPRRPDFALVHPKATASKQ